MKVYLLNPPFVPRYSRNSRWAARCRGGALYYPIWLSYAAGVLENNGHRVRLVDAPAWGWNLENVKEDIKNFSPDLIVGESNFQSLTNDVGVIKKIKTEIGAVSVLVGPPVSQFPERILNDGVDIAARFEYDFTIRDIAESIEDGSGLENIKGISYKKNGGIAHNPDRKFSTSEELDEIPFVSKVYKEHLNIKDYFLGHTLYPMVQIFTGRGCPNQCTFCSWPETLMGRKHRVRNVENVVDEFEYITKELPEVKEIFIEDDTFTIGKNRIKEVCSEIKRRGLDITWSCNARANLDYESMKAMKDAGCRLLDVGYESGNDTILKNIKKGITTNDSRKFTEDAKRAGLMILADFIFGMPGETKETAEQTIRFVKEIKPNIVQFSVATPLPGTEFYDYVKENGFLLVDDLDESLDKDGFQKCIVSYPDFTKDDIENYVDRGLKEYYLSPSYIPVAMRNVLRKNGLHELKGMVKSAKVFLKYMGRGR
ncbi:MAG: Ribosomal protein S12 methylthiotransferase RimO [Candidatus Argoarchaeum ethanivorans]|uniref:Ribosomal protein S12 methylthiotransferase RimO n=1 Tax=Candidatus Argoarchaeum ethanivorans TaxID=2608793 RepID=A0A811T4D4_9EURY|nr:MAG: Ribosomal protein S12 methylthiotransferase RimO [Candidatus Argoarchaeum ethanivorans]